MPASRSVERARAIRDGAYDGSRTLVLDRPTWAPTHARRAPDDLVALRNRHDAREETARHEAAHALIGWILGAQLRSITVRENSGETDIEWDVGKFAPGWRSPDELRSRIATAAAASYAFNPHQCERAFDHDREVVRSTGATWARAVSQAREWMARSGIRNRIHDLANFIFDRGGSISGEEFERWVYDVNPGYRRGYGPA